LRPNTIVIAVAVIVSVLAAASPSHAEIIYQKMDVRIYNQGTYALDLNGDGTTDFTVMFDYGRLMESPASGDGAEGTPPTPLKGGQPIGPNQQFSTGTQTMYWPKGQIRYLGLSFLINGETHYGWAKLQIFIIYFGPPKLELRLTGYAYETVPGMPINAGQLPPNFRIRASPASATVSPGQSTASTLTLTPIDGFSDTVTLTCKVPNGDGLGCEVSPSSVTLDGTDSATATLSMNTSPSTLAGTYKVSANGAYGALAHSTTFTLTVQ